MKKKRVIIYSGIAGGILVVFSLIFLKEYFLESLVIASMTGLVPYGLIIYKEHREISSMEKHFPHFLRDLAEARRYGMTLPKAIRTVSKKDYGPLTEDIKKLADQLSWGVPFPKATQNFIERVGKSDFIKRGLRIVSEAFRSGGDVAKVIDSIASSAEMIKSAEKEVRSKMYRHIMVMYVIFFLFIGITFVLMWIMKPLLEFQKGAETEFFGGLAGLDISYYKALFRNMLLIMGLFCGIVAGQVGEGSITAGIKHSLIMIISALIASLTILG